MSDYVAEHFLDGRVTLWRDDCLAVLRRLDKNSIDSCVTDPPYHLTANKRGGSGEKSVNLDSPYGRARITTGFMGKQWDGGDIAFRAELWAEVFRVLKPGAHLLAFSGTRTYHRMACAIEDAGFEIRDQIGWCYGSGFPKSHDISKAIDRAAGASRAVLGTVVGGARMDGNGDYRSTVYGSGWHGVKLTEPASDDAREWDGWGTALKPAWEPICLARKPISESSIAANVLKHGTGGINVDGCRVAGEKPLRETTNGKEGMFGLGSRVAVGSTHEGRWPANLIHDGSEEVLAGFPETGLASGRDSRGRNHQAFTEDARRSLRDDVHEGFGDSGSAARFFYTAKADQDDRLGSKHPTVKPLDLMQYLVRLITPKGGLVLDPFAGTGTTGEAAWREGMRAVLIEREAEYQADIAKRMGLCLAGPATRKAASAKPATAPLGGLFREGEQA